MAFPLSPYIVPRLFCVECGSELEPKIIRGMKNQVQEVRYADTTCRYEFIPSLQHCQGQMFPLKVAAPPPPPVATEAAAPPPPQTTTEQPGDEKKPGWFGR